MSGMDDGSPDMRGTHVENMARNRKVHPVKTTAAQQQPAGATVTRSLFFNYQHRHLCLERYFSPGDLCVLKCRSLYTLCHSAEVPRSLHIGNVNTTKRTSGITFHIDEVMIRDTIVLDDVSPNCVMSNYGPQNYHVHPFFASKACV